ncbi:family 78 glycoside hydrolase catalytic domain [Microbacterium rhizosphaerae]|uniref:alpha-L-rhamnosidase n=1 Tax=Microbacterium rhizosphaerae TaxID=1678237 RepID=A0ABZ0SSP8_9MICO|nr:family 78 glycoside hydrolase catalytic domain [Microbacterium rhizosphaerae]WPR90391.1 family 78 glycoside hydrolase catalytic domain [Microbacterium rhizosphaerae]
MPALPDLSTVDSSTRVTGLRSQYGDLLGVPAHGLRLDWRLVATDAGASVRQVGYQLADAPAGASLRECEPVADGSSIGVQAGDLAPGERRDVAVRVATEAGWTPWSDTLTLEAGLAGADLTARVIGIPSPIEGPVQLLRREFALDGAPVRARLRLSALGLVDAWVNGVKVSSILTPGWTSYQRRVLVDTIDVTDVVRPGANVIVLAVGDGWYRGRFGFANRTEIYGDRSGALAQLETEDGIVVATDETWRGGFGAVRGASLYDGTTVDLRETPEGLHSPGFDDSTWIAASVVPADLTVFEPRVAPPVRVVAELPMEATARSGATRLDGGQNITGWVRATVRGKAGDTVTVRHAEILDPKSGDLFTAALRTAKAIDRYVLDRDGEHVLEPVFTFHGFRYADVEGADVVSASAIAVSSDLPVRSSFRSSHEALNRFHSNVLWSQRDNFVSLPTDCPQRDERLGWTGDAQAFAPTASTLMDAETFWISWLRDLEIDQTDDGGVASVVPNIIGPGDMHMGGREETGMGLAGWADAATIVPLAVYDAYGSDEVLVRQLSSMRRWVQTLRRRAGEGVVMPTLPFQYGDWLDPDAPGDRPWQAKVSSDYVANAFYAQSARLLARAERIVGDPEHALEMDELADRVAAGTWEAWGEEAVTTQTGAAIALEFRIAPEARRDEIAASLAVDVRRTGGRISTGFLGTPLVLFALSHAGYLDEAYRMLLRRDAPSWLYQVDRGATTVWERWDAILPDGSIHSGAMDTKEGDSMLSFNHYAYGAMIDWVYRTVAGLEPAEPGYRTVRIAPRPAVGLDRADASIQTRLGTLSISWTATAEAFDAEVEIPFGSRGLLDLPITDESTVEVDGGGAAHELGAGRHRIRVTKPSLARP